MAHRPLSDLLQDLSTQTRCLKDLHLPRRHFLIYLICHDRFLWRGVNIQSQLVPP